MSFNFRLIKMCLVKQNQNKQKPTLLQQHLNLTAIQEAPKLHASHLPSLLQTGCVPLLKMDASSHTS